MGKSNNLKICSSCACGSSPGIKLSVRPGKVPVYR